MVQAPSRFAVPRSRGRKSAHIPWRHHFTVCCGLKPKIIHTNPLCEAIIRTLMRPGRGVSLMPDTASTASRASHCRRYITASCLRSRLPQCRSLLWDISHSVNIIIGCVPLIYVANSVRHRRRHAKQYRGPEMNRPAHRYPYPFRQLVEQVERPGVILQALLGAIVME